MPSGSSVIAGRAYVLIEAADKTGAVLTKVGRRFSEVGRAISSLGMKAVALGAALSVPFINALRHAKEYQDQILLLQGILDSTDSGMKALEGTIRMLGRTTSFSAKEVAMAAKELGRGAFSKEQIQNSLGAVLDLARAGELELSDAAKIMAQTIHVFGLEASDANAIADRFYNAARGGTTSVEELAQAFSYVGNTASLTGMSLDETLSILTVMANHMVTSTKAGTALNQMLTQMTKRQEELLDTIGVSVSDAGGNLREPAQIIFEIVKAVRNLPSGKRIAVLNEIFNVRGGRAGATVVADIENVMKAYGEIRSGVGSARKSAEEADSGIGGSIRRISDAIVDLAITLGKAFEEPFKRLEETFIPFVSFLAGFTVKFKDLFIKLGIATVALIAFGAAAIVIGTTLGAIGTIITFIGGAISVVASVFAALFTPVGAVIAAVIGLGVLLSTVWEDIKPTVVSAWVTISKTAGIAIDKIIGLFSSLWSFAKTMWEDWMKDAVIGFGKFLIGWIGTLVGIIFALFSDLATIIRYVIDIIRATYDWAKANAVIVGLFKAIGWVIDQAILQPLRWIKKAFDDLLGRQEEALNNSRDLVSGMGDTWTTVVEFIEKTKQEATSSLDKYRPEKRKPSTTFNPLEGKVAGTSSGKGALEKDKQAVVELYKKLRVEDEEHAIRAKRKQIQDIKNAETRKKKIAEIFALEGELPSEKDPKKRLDMQRRIRGIQKEIAGEDAKRSLDQRSEYVRDLQEYEQRKKDIEKFTKLQRATHRRFPGRIKGAVLPSRKHAPVLSKKELAASSELGRMHARESKLEEVLGKLNETMQSPVIATNLEKGTVEAFRQIQKSSLQEQMVSKLKQVHLELERIRRAILERETALGV